MPITRAQLEALYDAGLIRTCRTRPCPTCRRPTLVGLDADRAAREVRTELANLDPAAEARALLAGRDTYSVRRVNGKYRLYYRDQWNISGENAEYVVADHRCR